MSHIVQIQTQVRDAEAVRLACRPAKPPKADPWLGQAVQPNCLRPGGSASRLEIPRRLPARHRAVAVRRLWRQVGRKGPARPLTASVRRRASEAGSSQAGALGDRPPRTAPSNSPSTCNQRATLNRTIEITVSPTGETKLETKGFSGNSCRARGNLSTSRCRSSG